MSSSSDDDSINDEKVDDDSNSSVGSDDDVHMDAPTHGVLSVSKAPYMPAPMTLNLRFSVHRFFTYPVNWVLPVSKERLANSGFYLTLEFNSVQCHFCKLEITENYDWDSITSIDSLHQILNPTCPLVCGEDTTNIPIFDPTNYRYEAYRLYSLLITDWVYPVTPYDLAKYGFYWTGSSDNCRCAFCRLEVRGWEPEDTAESEHRRHNPGCVFMNDRAVGNVPIGREISQDAIVTDEAAPQNNHSPFSINPFARSELSAYGQIRYSITGFRPPVETLGVTPINRPKHAEYSALQSRLNSFYFWPQSITQKPAELAEAGFYYIGKGDRVICFQCGGGLNNWSRTDTPWCEHAKWFSRCPYLLLKKGKDYVDQTLKEQQIEMPKQDFQDALASVLEQEAREAVENAATIPDETKLDISLKCKLCNTNNIESVYLPCGHMVSCLECIDVETTCRTCRKPRVAYVRIFIQ